MRRLLLSFAALAMLASPAAAQNGQAALPQASPTVTSGIVLSNRPATLVGVQVTSGASAGYILVLDAAVVPADGAVSPKRCYPIAANTGLEANYRGGPLSFVTGVVVVFSTTGCFNKTASATAFISGDVR